MSFPFLSFKVYNNIIIPAKTRIFVQYGRYGNIGLYCDAPCQASSCAHAKFCQSISKAEFQDIRESIVARDNNNKNLQFWCVLASV